MNGDWELLHYKNWGGLVCFIDTFNGKKLWREKSDGLIFVCMENLKLNNPWVINYWNFMCSHKSFSEQNFQPFNLWCREETLSEKNNVNLDQLRDAKVSAMKMENA